jgi:hypothetical protein
MTRTFARVAAAAAVLLVASAALAGAPVLDAALPNVVWDSGLGTVFVSPPAPVAAWMAGEIADPDGTLERLAAAYEQQRESPGFAPAVLQIREIVLDAIERQGLSDTEVNLRLIPQILHARDDLRAELLMSGDVAYPGEPVTCWEQKSGKLFCTDVWAIWCLAWGCREDPANTCTILVACANGAPTPGGGVAHSSDLY